MASTRDWFETVAEARRRARRRLPGPVFLAIEAGSEAGVTRADNLAAFAEIEFAPPRLADLPQVRDLRTTVLGTDIALPVLASPVGAQAVHPLGEVGVALGTRDAGTAMGLSEFASRPAAAVAAANPKLFFQVHWSADRDTLLERAELAKAGGATALIVTLDWSFPGGRDWGSPAIPERLDLKTLARLAPAGLARPGYLLDWLRHGGLPGLTVPNMALPGQPAPGFFAAYRDWMTVPPPTWADIAWLREHWDGPFLVKGVMRPEDARRAIDAGATAISVSNHGGNNLDGTPASIRALPGSGGRGGRPGRGPARRRRPPRRRRGQGARPRRARRHDRPSGAVGSRGWRPLRSTERVRHPPFRHRLRPARARPCLDP